MAYPGIGRQEGRRREREDAWELFCGVLWGNSREHPLEEQAHGRRGYVPDAEPLPATRSPHRWLISWVDIPLDVRLLSVWELHCLPWSLSLGCWWSLPEGMLVPCPPPAHPAERTCERRRGSCRRSSSNPPRRPGTNTLGTLLRCRAPSRAPWGVASESDSQPSGPYQRHPPQRRIHLRTTPGSRKAGRQRRPRDRTPHSSRFRS